MTIDFVSSTVKKYNMLNFGDTVVVGLSGGADSVCLLSILCALKEEYALNIIAAHINHGIRGDEAQRDEQFCIDYCCSLGVKLEILHADIPAISRQRKQSLEQCGREVRYDFFKSLSGEKGKIATAHNLNDNAETVLLNITRGSGTKGLCGIPAVRENIIRPLIETDRQTIENYCKQNNLSFVTDSTNLSNDYSRNKIRNLVLPVLNEINPSVLQAFSRLISTSAQEEKLLDSMSRDAFLSCLEHDKLNISKLDSFDEAIKKRAVIQFIRRFTDADVSCVNVESVLSLCENGKSVDVAGNITLRRRCGFLEYADNTVCDEWSVNFKKNDSVVTFLSGYVKIDTYDTKDLQNLNKDLLANLIDCDKINNTLELRSRRSGDSFTFSNRNVTKSLKKLFNEEKIPPEKRNDICIIADGQDVLWVEGFGVSKKYKVDNNTTTAMKITVERGKDNG